MDLRSRAGGYAHILADDNGNPSAALRAKKFFIDRPAQPHAIRKCPPARFG